MVQLSILLIFIIITSNKVISQFDQSHKQKTHYGIEQTSLLIKVPETTSVNQFMEKVDPDEKYLVFNTDHDHEIDNDNRELNLNLLANKTAANFQRELSYYKRLSHKMRLIISPILLIIGGIGNPLCIIILLRKRKPNSTIIYLCLLALIDVLVLGTGLFRQYLKEIFNVDLRDFSSFTCKLHVSKSHDLNMYV